MSELVRTPFQLPTAATITTGARMALQQADGSPLLGIEVDALLASLRGGVSFSVPVSFVPKPLANETLLYLVMTEGVEFAPDFAGSRGKVAIAPSEPMIFTLFKNPALNSDAQITGGTNIGTITIAANGDFTFATTDHAAVTLAVGEVIAAQAPAVEATGAFTLRGKRL